MNHDQARIVKNCEKYRDATRFIAEVVRLRKRAVKCYEKSDPRLFQLLDEIRDRSRYLGEVANLDLIFRRVNEDGTPRYNSDDGSGGE